jgi:hypothetical protein
MKSFALLLLVGLCCAGCNNDPVERPYIISQSQESVDADQEFD